MIIAMLIDIWGVGYSCIMALHKISCLKNSSKDMKVCYVEIFAAQDSANLEIPWIYCI